MHFLIKVEGNCFGRDEYVVVAYGMLESCNGALNRLRRSDPYVMTYLAHASDDF